VIGPKRMAYEEIVPQIQYFSGLLEEIVKEQQL
jgi:heat-inducible transcriptional repressor